MWLGHDLGWWSFILSVAAVILATIGIPVAIIAPLIAPKLEDWWATRSDTSIRERIATLERRLSEYERGYEQLREAEVWMLKGIQVLGILGSMILLCIAACILALATIYKPPHSWLWGFPFPLQYLSLPATVTAFGLILWFGLTVEAFRTRRSPGVRRALKSSIRELNSRIPSK